MLGRLKISLVLFAWLLATGSQWDLLQTLAWGRMTVDNAQTMTLTEAVARTFSPDTLCPVCRAVAAAKQEQSGNSGVPSGGVEGKILIVFQPAPMMLAPVQVSFPWLENGGITPGASRAAPPLPPPRAV